tara:strand:- start:90 stop:254 length:165 start_codon:yes stop_codon:yes gene_type:complete
MKSKLKGYNGYKKVNSQWVMITKDEEGNFKLYFKSIEEAMEAGATKCKPRYERV